MRNSGGMTRPQARQVTIAQFAIRCLPRVPVASEDLERWLEQELEELRDDIPRGTIRLSRLTEPLPTTDVGIGWLIEFDLPEDQHLFGSRRLESVLRDLRLLGFQPTLLAPLGVLGLSGGRHANDLTFETPSERGE
jgi:hypothetical protein